MAGFTVRPKSQEVIRGKNLVDLQVAVAARILIERRSIALGMAILADKGRVV